MGVAGNSHCPHHRDCSPGRSQAAWAESPEEEGRTAGPRHSECLILGRRGGTASLNLQTSLRNAAPSTSSRAQNLKSLQRPKALPLFYPRKLHCPALGLGRLYIKAREHSTHRSQGQHYVLISTLFPGGWALSFLASDSCHSVSLNGSETAQKGSSTRFSRTEPHSNPCWLSQLTGSKRRK